jgi:hypothetical protein
MAEAAERMADAVARIQGVAAESEPLTEEEADRFALAAVHRAREELGRDTEGPTPSRADVQRWAARREELRDTEAGGDL